MVRPIASCEVVNDRVGVSTLFRGRLLLAFGKEVKRSYVRWSSLADRLGAPRAWRVGAARDRVASDPARGLTQCA
jgi:hypothetical protein